MKTTRPEPPRKADGKNGTDHRNVTWRQALDLAAECYRLAETLRAGVGARLAEQLTETAARIPARLAQATRGGAAPLQEAEAGLLEAETLLFLAVQLKQLPEGRAQTALSMITALLDGLPVPAPELPVTTEPVPAPAPVPPAPAPAPAPPPAPAPAVVSGSPAPPVVEKARPAFKAPAPPEQPPDRLLVDGCNFLGRAYGYALGDEKSRDRLLFRLQEYGRAHPAHHITVFFDSQRTSSQVIAGVEQRTSAAGREADDSMIDFVRTLPAADRRRCTLVTDDRELARRARNEGVRVESIAWLVSRVERTPLPTSGGRPETGLSRNELSEWEQFFNQPPRRPGKGT